MKERMCNLFEKCETPEAPLCPIELGTINNGIWYPGEQICRSKKFKDLPWIKKQKQIAGLKFTADKGFFTVRMLNAIHVVTPSLQGANPDDLDAELKWFQLRSEKKTMRSNQVHRTKSSKKSHYDTTDTGEMKLF